MQAKTPEAKPSGAAANSAAPSGGVGTFTFSRGGAAVGRAFNVEDSPEGRRAAIREAVTQSFGGFFRKMNWDARQQELFKELWSERKERERVLIEQTRAPGQPPDRTAAQNAMREAAREFDVKLEATFGAGAVAGMRDYVAKGGFRHVAEETAKRVFYSDAPLSHQQADLLSEIMAQNARRPDGKLDIAAMNLEAVLAQAQAMLTPAQLTAFRETEAELRRQRDLEERAWAERKNAAPPAAK